MKITYILTALSATLAMAAPAEPEKNALEPQACLPASCQSFGVSSRENGEEEYDADEDHSAALATAATGA